jgi:HlyD family secretion protein
MTMWHVIAAAMMVAASSLSALAQQRPAAPVVVAPVVERDVAAGQSFVGTVMPLRRSVVGSAVSGRVIEFFVNEGDKVKKDQPLAQLRLDALQIQRAAAVADWNLRKQELAEMENGMRPEEVEQAKARAQGARAMMEFRAARQKRLELMDRRVTSADELQDAASAAEFASQTFLEARKAWELAVAGPRKEKIAQSKARVDAAQEEVNRIDDQIRKHTVVSPFDGYVVAEHTEVGQWISQAAPVAEVIEVEQVEISIPLLEDYVSNLQRGQVVRVDVNAIKGRFFEGTVALIVPQADIKSRSFPVKVRVENKFVDELPVLKPGMIARVTLPVGPNSSAMMVPKDAVVLGGASPVVYVVAAGKADAKTSTVRLVPVQLGVVEGEFIQVKGELQANDRVVVQGNERLMPGQDISILPAADAKKTARRE